MSVRLWETLQLELDITIHDVIFWTDAMTVLKYIRNDQKRWKIFVANRVSEIRESTQPNQWRYVPSHLNVADCCTRGLSASDITVSHEWLAGPAFLSSDENSWPEQPLTFEVDSKDENLRRDCCLNAVSTIVDHDNVQATVHHYKVFPLVDPSRFSSFLRLQRTTAWFLRAVKCFRSGRLGIQIDGINSKLLSSEEMSEAEMCLVRSAQQDVFMQEMLDLKSGRELNPNSSLRSLSPFLDKENDVI